MALIPLANPKGVKLNCELCSKLAFRSCDKCRVTYYCSLEHQNIDWVGIHEKICQLLVPLRTPIPFTSGSEEERAYQRNQRVTRHKQLINITGAVCQKLLFEGKYEYAIPAALQSLKNSMEIFGIDSIELVPSYLNLGEACIGLSRLSQAEEYLSQAQWTILKTPECKDELKSRLHRNLGMLYAAQENFEKALENLAEDIYYASCAFGTDDIRTAGGYFHMAKIFHHENKLEIAFSLYSTLVCIWHDHLMKLVKQRIIDPTASVGFGPAKAQSIESQTIDVLDETEVAEAIYILNAISKVYEDQFSSVAEGMIGKLYFTLAMLYMVVGEKDQAVDFNAKYLLSIPKDKTDGNGEIIDHSKFTAAISEMK